ncbi:hypothetical protein NXC24_PB00263 (plasmid) [Rhizobium sp. NXC24]|nr:hypothetical protein NXC24_PB00263 [Rhizobium sp. NXC24]
MRLRPAMQMASQRRLPSKSDIGSGSRLVEVLKSLPERSIACMDDERRRGSLLSYHGGAS